MMEQERVMKKGTSIMHLSNESQKSSFRAESLKSKYEDNYQPQDNFRMNMTSREVIYEREPHRRNLSTARHNSMAET